MDILDTVRDMKPDHAFTPHAAQAPRRALHREMARAERVGPLKRVAFIAVGGAAAAAIAVTASTFAPPGTVGEPQAASAATHLNETAASIRAAAVAGQPTETTITLEQLLMVGGSDAVLEPFGSIRTGAIGAVITESSDTYVSQADGGAYTWTSNTEFHAREVFGDEAAVEAAWNSYYGETHIGVLGKEPATSAPEVTTTIAEHSMPVPVDDFPAEPQAFLDAWTSGMEELGQERMAERAAMTPGGAGDPNAAIADEYKRPTAGHMMAMLATSVVPHIAPPAYRATFLEALALADGITVEAETSGHTVLVFESAERRYRLTIDPAAGTIISAEEFELQVLSDGGAAVMEQSPLVEVGSASFVPEGTPDYAVRITSVPVS